MIRSSQHSLKFATKFKLLELSDVLHEYRKVVQDLVDIYWSGLASKFDPKTSNLEVKTYYPKETLDSIDTWLSARLKQAAGKQACSMLKSAVKKRQKQYFMLKKLQKQGKNTKHLRSKIDRVKLVKPNAANINMELDSRFVDIQDGNHFDLFVRLSSIGNRKQIRLPIKKTRVSNKWAKSGQLKKSIRINENCVTLYYEVEKKTNKGDKTVAIDQGLTTTVTMSDGQVTGKCPHGHDLKSIQQKMSRCKKGSKAFKRAQKHRTNYINWSIGRLNLDGVKTIRLEELKNVRKGRSASRLLSHWTYTEINDKIIQKSEYLGIDVETVSNKYRSQRCFECGFTHKSNRSSEKFCCRNCGSSTNADFNAAKNLMLDLPEVPDCVWGNKLNRSTGFFWDLLSIITDEDIVRQNKKAEM